MQSLANKAINVLFWFFVRKISWKICQENFMKNLLGKFHAELSQQRLASQAEPSQAEPSRDKPSQAKPSQAKFAYHGLPRFTTAYHGLPLLTTAYHGLFFRLTHQSKVHTIAVLFFKKSSRKSIISDFPYNTSIWHTLNSQSSNQSP